MKLRSERTGCGWHSLQQGGTKRYLMGISPGCGWHELHLSPESWARTHIDLWPQCGHHSRQSDWTTMPELASLHLWCQVAEHIICKPEIWYYRITCVLFCCLLFVCFLRKEYTLRLVLVSKCKVGPIEIQDHYYREAKTVQKGTVFPQPTQTHASWLHWWQNLAAGDISGIWNPVSHWILLRGWPPETRITGS